MTILGFLLLLLVAGVCGVIGQQIAGYSRGGLIVAVAVGWIGALLGMWLAGKLDLPEPFPVELDTTTFPVLWSIIGSTLFVAVVAFLSRGRARIA